MRTKKQENEDLIHAKYVGRRNLFVQSFNGKKYCFHRNEIKEIPKKLYLLCNKIFRGSLEVAPIIIEKIIEKKIESITKQNIDILETAKECIDVIVDLKKCEKCGEEFKNLGSHLRFCKGTNNESSTTSEQIL